MHKAGFVNIVGNPNVGKSTLMNQLVGEHISIATFKAQTTRHRIMGIVNTEESQIVFSDTPGVLKPNYKLQESMLAFSESALVDADVLLYMTDVVEKPDKNSDFLEKVSGQKFVFVKSRETDKMLFCKIGNGTIAFDVIASTGTQSLKLLYFWLKKMGDASFVFIDEFDAFYHFKLAFEVCKQLFNLNCQVFTSSHNTYLMTNDLLRPDCNFILQDNKIKPLQACTEKELRFGHNIEKLFRAGAFEV